MRQAGARFFPQDLFDRGSLRRAASGGGPTGRAVSVAAADGPSRRAALSIGQADDGAFRGTVVDRQTALRAGVSVTRQTVLGNGFVLETALFAGVGQSGYRLPDGLGIFGDPMDIQLSSVTVAPELRLVRQVHLGRVRVDLTAGGGVEASTVRTTLRSALFDLSDRYSGLSPYATLGVTVSGDAPRWTLALDARSIPDASGWQMRGELRVPLSRN